MGINIIGIFNGTFYNHGNKKSTIGNGENFIDETGLRPRLCIFYFSPLFKLKGRAFSNGFAHGCVCFGIKVIICDYLFSIYIMAHY